MAKTWSFEGILQENGNRVVGVATVKTVPIE